MNIVHGLEYRLVSLKELYKYDKDRKQSHSAVERIIFEVIN
jgi:hypothetical protein